MKDVETTGLENVLGKIFTHVLMCSVILKLFCSD